MRIWVFEDGWFSDLEPLTLTRPTFALRCGADTLLERQRRYFDAREMAALLPDGRAELCRLTNPDRTLADPAVSGAAPVVLVNARWLPLGAAPPDCSTPGFFLAGQEPAYVVLPPGEESALAAGELTSLLARWRLALPQRPAGGVVVRYPWDLVQHNAAALEDDWRHWYAERESADVPAGVTLLGPRDRLRIDPSARVEPQVVIDTTKGPVLIDGDAVVQAFSRVEGPCHVGPRTQLLSAHVRGASFGPECRVGGEVECSVVHGYANKAHDGFLGHSYVGEWVNLGAGTHTSDLRTDYGTVRMTVNGARVDTGLMKVGSFLGDHTKTSVNVLFNTGTAVGPFAQLLACGTLLPRRIPAFCRYADGRLDERTDLGQMFATAAAMMARRGRAWTDADADYYFDLYEATAAGRRQLLREAEQRRLRRVV